MLIRDEQPGDVPAIRAVVEVAFPQPLEADLVDRLRAEGDSVISLVATDGEAVVGHVLLSRMAAPFRALGLGPLAVLPGRQRAGIGGLLVRESLRRAAAQGWQGVFVLGDPAYYRRFGFDPATARGFASPYAGPYLMLLPFSDGIPREGRIDYAPAFAALG